MPSHHGFFEPLMSYRYITALIFTAMFAYSLLETWLSYRSIYDYLEKEHGRYRFHRIFKKYVICLIVSAPIWRFKWIFLQILLLCSAVTVTWIEAWRLQHS